MVSYGERYRSLRETKTAHTLAKLKQNGHTDLDDFGTVPIQEGYKVIPFYNSENGSFYGLYGMSENFCRVLAAHEPYVDKMEMLCGRWRDMLVNYRGDIHYMPDWLKENLKNIEFIKNGANALWSKRWDEQRFPYDHLKGAQKKYNITSGIDSDAHFACDYRIGFSLGFGGLLEKVRCYRNINKDKKDFYDAEERCLLAIIDFIERHIEKIKELIAAEDDPDIKASLTDMLKVNENIVYDPPKTFHEVCQWTVYFNCASRIYTRDGAGFQLDTLLYPYYKRDKENGILDDEKARFLIANLLLTDPHYYQLSGVDENDNDLTNELSYIILEGADRINVSCNLTVRVHPAADREFFKKAVRMLVKNKNGWPRFANDEALSIGYMRNGFDKKTARERICVGCNWMCVPGREFPMNDTVKVNIAKVLEVALYEMKEEKERSLSRLFRLFEKHLGIALDTVAKGVNLHLDHIAEVTPELIMNLMMKNSIETGTDASRCAEIFTVGVDGAGLATVADSLAAIEERVERDALVSWDELYTALDNNFENKRVRAIMQSTPKYCSGGSTADAWAIKLTKCFVNAVKSQKMPKNRMLIPGWFSWARSIEYGKTVGATPNGRLAGEPLTHGANPSPHFIEGGAITAQSNGIASVQCGYGNTAPLQIELDPIISDEAGAAEFVSDLILGHFALGGTLVNINVLDKKTLMKAKEDPLSCPDLVVRVTGFTAYFASLSPKFRNLVIERFLENV